MLIYKILEYLTKLNDDYFELKIYATPHVSITNNYVTADIGEAR